MPVTPLHLAAGGIGGGKDYTLGFIMAQCAIDFDVVLKVFSGIPGPAHGTSHTLWGAIFLAFIGTVLLNWKWWKGALVGAISHVLLDAVVHEDVRPFWPFIKENPLYINNSLEVVTYLCLCVILIHVLLIAICEVTWGTLSESDWD